jgi:hypothetical protein
MMKELTVLVVLVCSCAVEETPAPRYPAPAPSPCATNGATRCATSWLQTCTNNAWSGTADCALAGAACAESATTAGTYLCEAVTTCTQMGAERCNNDVIETCDVPDWVSVQDCTLTGGTCLPSGSMATCQPANCTAGQLDDTMCFDDLLMTCNGSGWLLTEDCQDLFGFHICQMEPFSGVASCVVDPSAICNASQLGSTKCDGNMLMECNGTVYALKEDCAATIKTCVEFFAGVARCEEADPPAGLLGSCTGTGQGNCESADLTCGEVSMLSDNPLCLLDCTSNQAQCTTLVIDGTSTPGYCEPGTIEGGGAFSSSPFCFWISDRNGMCLFNDSGCSAGTCQSIADGLNPECKVSCAGNEVDTTGSCTGGETCLAAPYVEIEKDGADDKICTTVDTQDNCSATYMCTTVGVTETTTALLCARRAGLCGAQAATAAAFTSQADVSTWVDDDTHLCELVGVDQYCGADHATGAPTECVSSGFAFRYDPAIVCGGFEDALGCFGLGECITFDGVNFECGTGINVCQTFCTSADGLDEFTCDTGTCQTPTYPIGRPALEFDVEGQPIECTLSTSIECSGGFTCSDYFSDGDFCMKTRMVCGP